jgi:hypothetical protein
VTARGRGGAGFGHEPPAGGSCEWYTPPEIFRALGLPFALDPCAPPWPRADWIPAARRYSPPDDGLELPWFGRVWLNPPYARETARWVARLAEHGDGIALVFARTDTAWWQAAIAGAHAVCFIAGRVNFIPSDPRFRSSNGTPSSAGAPSCLLAYGDDCAGALIRSGLGACLVAEDACVRAQLELWEAAA